VEYSQKYHVGTKSYSLSCEDAQDKDDWRLRIKGTTGKSTYQENGHKNGMEHSTAVNGL